VSQVNSSRYSLKAAHTRAQVGQGDATRSRLVFLHIRHFWPADCSPTIFPPGGMPPSGEDGDHRQCGEKAAHGDDD